jgi:uncharacterized membrane protein YtjA (UPF0391 family)
MPIVSIIVGLIIVMLLFWAITTIMGAFGIGEPIATVVKVVFVVLVVLWLVSLIGGLGVGSFPLGHSIR